MAEGNTIERVQVEIEASVKGTNAVFSQLEKNLTTLKTALNSIDVSKLEQIKKSTTNLSVNTSGMSKSEREISKSVNSIKQALAGLNSYKNAALGGDSSSLTSFNRRVVSIQSSIDVLREKISQLAKPVPTEAFTKLKAEEEATEAKISELKAKIQEVTSGNVSMSGDQFQQLKNDLTEAEAKLADVSAKQQDLINSGESHTDPFASYRDSLEQVQQALSDTKAEVESATATMETDAPTIDTSNVSSGLSDIAEKASLAASSLLKMSASAIKSGISNIVSNLKKMKSTLSDIGGKASGAVHTGFTKILKYGFGIRSMYVLFRRLKQAIKDSFTELQNSGAFYQTTRANVEALKTSLTTLKYQFGAAFEPIFNTVAPALQTLINYLVAVMNTLSAFIAKLTGKSTYSKAVASTAAIASNTGSAAGSAKELNKQLQGFDELNNLTSNSGSGGGGGGGSSSDASNVTYVEESVDNALTSFWNSLANDIKNGDWYSVGSTISEKLQEVLNSINWDSIYQKAINFGSGLANFLNGLFKVDNNGNSVFSSLGGTIASALNTAFKALNSFGTTFDWSEFGKSIGTGITNFFKTADFGEWGDTVHTWIAGILDAGIALLANTDFKEIGEKIADFLNGLQVSDIASKLFTFAKSLVSGIAEAISSLWNNADLQTKIGLAIAGMLVAGNLTGLSASLGGALTSYFLTNPIVLGKVALAITEFTLVFDTAREGFGDWADFFGDTDLSSYYKNFTWSEFWNTITNNGEGIDTSEISEAWGDMCYDYFNPLFEAIDGWIDNLKEKINSLDLVQTFKNLTNKIKAAWNGANGNGNGYSTGYNGAPSDVAEKLDEQARSEYWKEQGAYIVDGIKEGIVLSLKTNPFTAPIVLLYEAIRDAIKNKFEIDSPAKAMYDMGKYIFLGIIEGFKEEMSNFGFDDLVNYVKEKLTNTSTVKTGGTAKGDFSNVSDLLHSGKTTTTWNIKTKFSGGLTSKSDYSTFYDDVFNINQNLVDKDANYDIDITGDASNSADLTTIKTRMTDLTSSWNGKNASLNVSSDVDKADGYVSKFNEVRGKWTDTTANFKTTFTNFDTDSKAKTGKTQIENFKKNVWTDKTANFKTKVESLSGKDDGIKKFSEQWPKYSKEATFKTTLTGAATNADGFTKLGSAFESLNNFKAETKEATYKVTTSGATSEEMRSYADAQWYLDQWWKGGSHTASYSIDFSGDASGVKTTVNNIIDQLNNAVSRAGMKGVSIPHVTATGGIFTAAANRIIGEDGAEAVVPLEKNTGWLKVMSNMMLDGLADASKLRMASPASLTSNIVSDTYTPTNDTSELVREQNALLREQNGLLRQIAQKNVSISSHDVFNATRTEANNYYNRTGNSPFLI